MKQIISAVLLSILLAACSKHEVNRPGSASLIIFHGVTGANNLKTFFSNTPPAVFETVNTLLYGVANPYLNNYAPIAGSHPLSLYQVPDTLEKSEPLFRLQLELPEGSMQTLFLTGSPATPDHVLVNDDVLRFPAGDSAMGIRFVNLMAGGFPVSINQATQSPGSEIPELPYKGITAFKKYDVNMSQADYVFEIRNASNGEWIASFAAEGIANDGLLTPNEWLYRNFTLALVGVPDGTGSLAPKIVKINYHRVN